MLRTHSPRPHAPVQAHRRVGSRGFEPPAASPGGGHDLSRVAVSPPVPAAGAPIQRVILKSDGTPYKRLDPDSGTWAHLDDRERLHLRKLHGNQATYTIAEASARAQRLAGGRKAKKAKKVVPPFVFDPSADYSDSEDEAETSGNAFAKKFGMSGSKAVFNYTKRGKGAYRKGVKGLRPKVNNTVHPDDADDVRMELENEASMIHDVLPATDDQGKASRTFGATTITTSLMHKPSTGLFKKFAFSNLELMPPDLRDKAEELGYHVVKAQQSHAEGEKIQYDTAREGVYEHNDMGTDKEHCAECEWAMGEKYGAGVQTETGFSGKTFKNWHNPEALQEALGLSTAATPTRDKEGNLKKRKSSS